MRHASSPANGNRETKRSRRSRRTRKFAIIGTRAGTVGIVACGAVVAAAGLAAALLVPAHGKSAARLVAGDLPKVSAGHHHSAAPPKHMRKLVHRPVHKAKPKPSPSASPSASVTRTPTMAPTTPASTAPASSAPTSSAPASSAPATTPPAAPTAPTSSSCQNPQYTTSATDGMWNLSPYFVANDMWNAGNYSVSQTISACSYSNWNVTAKMDNSSGDGAVKTYPNSHRDFDNEPQISSFGSITSTFAETDPGSGIYEDAYDIWLNGIGSSGASEVMIWTNNHGQTPGGSVQGTVTLDGRSWTVWRAGTYFAFVPASNFTAGSMDLKSFFEYLMSKGWISGSSTLGQVDYGVELVSTNGAPETFSVSNFSVSAS